MLLGCLCLFAVGVDGGIGKRVVRFLEVVLRRRDLCFQLLHGALDFAAFGKGFLLIRTTWNAYQTYLNGNKA